MVLVPVRVPESLFLRAFLFLVCRAIPKNVLSEVSFWPVPESYFPDRATMRNLTLRLRRGREHKKCYSPLA
jgi:hypothetical protein